MLSWLSRHSNKKFVTCLKALVEADFGIIWSYMIAGNAYRLLTGGGSMSIADILLAVVAIASIGAIRSYLQKWWNAYLVSTGWMVPIITEQIPSRDGGTDTITLVVRENLIEPFHGRYIISGFLLAIIAYLPASIFTGIVILVLTFLILGYIVFISTGFYLMDLVRRSGGGALFSDETADLGNNEADDSDSDTKTIEITKTVSGDTTLDELADMLGKDITAKLNEHDQNSSNPSSNTPSNPSENDHPKN